MLNVQMELTNYCNLECVECPNRDMKRKRKYMSKQVFNKIIKDYIAQVPFDTIILNKDGEPLMHPDFKEMVTAISEVTDKKIDLYTNGIFLTKELVQFFGTLKNPVSILLTFHRYNYDGKRNNTYMKVSEKLIDIFRTVNAENVSFILVVHHTDYEDPDDLKSWEALWNKMKEESPMIRNVIVNTVINSWTRKQIKQERLGGQWSNCPYEDFDHFFIGVTGNVVGCCGDLEEEVKFGNVLRNSRDEIWAKVEKFYAELKNQKVEEELCKVCLNR